MRHRPSPICRCRCCSSPSAAMASSPPCSGRSNTASCRFTWKLVELPAGNALVEGGTFLAILIGMVAGNFATGQRPKAPTISRSRCHRCFAVLCWMAAPLRARHRRGRPQPAINRVTSRLDVRLAGPT